jgi:chlorophyllide a reductase subunit Y
MVSARPLLGPAGAASLAGIVAAQTRGKDRFAKMLHFFDGVGVPEAAGYGWKGVPDLHPEARAKARKMREARAKAAEAVGT